MSDPADPNRLGPQVQADEPIRTIAEDLLGRVGFARSLSTALGAWTPSSSVVVALNGAWGSGKTSIKNMALELLGESSNAETPRVVDFNPWVWEGHASISQEFFACLADTVGLEDPDEDLSKTLSLLREYSAWFEAAGAVVRPLRPAITALFTLVGVSALLAAYQVVEFSYSRFGPRWGAISLILIGALFLCVWIGLSAAEVLSKVSDALERRSLRRRRSPRELKADIAQALSDSDTRILVVMDDIDRLGAAELLVVFQLLKAHADIPGLTYLLLFDREVVEGKIEGELGPRYLEKVVQVRLDVPAAERAQVDHIIESHLRQVAKAHGIDLEEKRFLEILFGPMRGFFQNVRDVRRFQNTLELSLALLFQDCALEVNFVDLAALETLRSFDPAVHGRLPSYKEFLLSRRRSLIFLEAGDDREGVEEALNELVNFGDESRRSLIQELVDELFPDVRVVHGGAAVADHEREEHESELRVCHRDYFDRYFNLSVPTGAVPQAAIDEVLENSGDLEAVRSVLSRFSFLPQASELAARLHAQKAKVAAEGRANIITGLLDIGDVLSADESYSYGVRPSMFAIWTINGFLAEIQELDARSGLLLSCIERTSGLWLPIDFVLHEEQRLERDPEATGNLREADVGVGREVCIEKIREAAEAGKLHFNPCLAKILGQWKDWGGIDEIQEWLSTLLDDPQRVESFLRAFLQESSAQEAGSRTATFYRYIRWRSLDDWIGFDRLVEAVDAIDRSGLPEEDQRVFQIFDEAKQRRDEGVDDSSGIDFLDL